MMTLEQEFQKQWNSLCNYIKSEMLNDNVGVMEPSYIQSVFEREKKKWFLPGQYNNAWFEKLKRTDLEVAIKFEAALKNINIVPANLEKGNSKLSLGVTTIIGAAVGFGVSRLFVSALVPSLLWILGGAGIGAVIGIAICSKKKEELSNALYLAYGEQLKKAGEMLSQIVSQTN